MDADKFLQRAMADIGNALSSSELDMWGVGGSYADITERNALSRTQSLVSQVEMLISQAQRIQPLVSPIPPISIAQGNVVSDIIFDNIFTDYAFHEKIEQSKRELKAAWQRLTMEIQAGQLRQRALKQEVEQAASTLDHARKELQQVRQEAFARVVANSKS
jgi:hypothetical protein